MVLELHDETYQCIKETYSAFAPIVEFCSPYCNILDYYKKVNEEVDRKECNYIELYNGNDVIITPKTPSIVNPIKSNIHIKLSDDNSHDIYVSSRMDIGVQLDTSELGLVHLDFNLNQKIILLNKNLRNFENYFTIIYTVVKKDTRAVDCVITIKIFLDNPIYYNADNYIVNNDNIKLIYYSNKAYKPSYRADCICHLDMLGSDRCSLKKYLSIKRLQEYINEFNKIICIL